MADKILVMNEGRLAECGRHEDLLRLGGIYATLYETQFNTGKPIEDVEISGKAEVN